VALYISTFHPNFFKFLLGISQKSFKKFYVDPKNGKKNLGVDFFKQKKIFECCGHQKIYIFTKIFTSFYKGVGKMNSFWLIHILPESAFKDQIFR
jgi:hypothetical protein